MNHVMSQIWKNIDKHNWSERSKYIVICLLLALFAVAAGLCVWGVVQLWALDHWTWMVIFGGYPPLFALVWILIYSFNHSFHNGSYAE